MADQNGNSGISAQTPQPSVAAFSPDNKYVFVDANAGSVKKRLPLIVVVIIAAIAIVGALYYLASPHQQATTTIPTTTSIVGGQKFLSACGSIASPGAYSLSSDIKTNVTNAPCLNITASDVIIACNGKSITGSGPFTGIGPFSYGISVQGQDNVVIDNCLVSNFSYGVYSRNVGNLTLNNSNITTNYISNIYLGSTTNSTIEDTYVASSSSPRGAINITNGSTRNIFLNNTLKSNALFGFNINASGNRFLNNYAQGSRFSFTCSPIGGLPKSNIASGNICYNQSGCSFLTCIGTNVPNNVSKIVLQKRITTCGTINSPGNYYLQASINDQNYTGFSVQELAQYNEPCVVVASPNVNLACNGYNISYAYAGISVSSGFSNISISGCRLLNSDIGVLVGASAANVSNSVFLNNNVSAELNGANGTKLFGISSTGSNYGVLLYNTSATVTRNFSLIGNKYGLYLNNSFGNLFTTGTAHNSSRFDVFATPSGTANASSNFMLSTSCGITNAQWATCSQYTTNSTNFIFPINGCATLKTPGTYVLQKNLIGVSANCMKIQTNGVWLSCNGKMISATPGSSGSAVVASGVTNISVSNCRISNYYNAVNITNSSVVAIKSIKSNNQAYYGIFLKGITLANLSNVSVSGGANAGIALYDVKSSRISNNIILLSPAPAVALLVANSTNNIIANNKGIQINIGMYITGQSTNNTIYNNTFDSGHPDYLCAPQDSPIFSEFGGINSGTIKQGCYWLVLLLSTPPQLPCSLITGGTFFSFTTDYLYGAGTTCFTIKGPGTTIDCNGHTIMATNGGIFAQISNTTNVAINNCFLKGFNYPIQSFNSTVALYNNTIYQNMSLGINASAINIVNGSNSNIQANNITTPNRGISIIGASSALLLSNNVTSSSVSYYLSKVTGIQITNNTATKQSSIGLVLSDVSGAVLRQNTLYGSGGGLVCLGTSASKGGATDQGNNYCSSSSSCAWISSSLPTC